MYFTWCTRAVILLEQLIGLLSEPKTGGLEMSASLLQAMYIGHGSAHSQQAWERQRRRLKKPALAEPEARSGLVSMVMKTCEARLSRQARAS